MAEVSGVGEERAAASSASRGPGRLTSARRTQHGFGLVEVIVALMITSMVVLSLAAGLVLVVRTTAATSERQRAQTALGSYTEQLKAAPYQPCASASDYQAVIPPPSGEVELVVVGVRYWRVLPTGDGEFTDSCSPGSDLGAQHLLVQASLGDALLRGHVVKGNR